MCPNKTPDERRITIRGKFGMSGKSELGIAQEVDTRNAEAEFNTA